MKPVSAEKVWQAEYKAQLSWWRLIMFWLVFWQDTLLGKRKLGRLVRWRTALAPLPQVEGLHNVPPTGSFVLAVNHFNGGPTIDVLAIALTAANLTRPDLADDYLVVIGQRGPKRTLPPYAPAHAVRRVLSWVYRRWQHNTVRISLDNPRVSLTSLRVWRERSQQQPCILFPEGLASTDFRAVRPGSGRWLSGLGVPIVPVGVWWHQGLWHVRFGPPLVWPARPELHDFYLGINIALQLPPALAPAWQEHLAHWRASWQS